jgi:hypothetical protein
MKTSKKLNPKKIAAVGIFMLTAKLTFAQTFKSEINKALEEYFVPVIALAMVVCVAIAVIKNWDLITDKHQMKEGIINVGWFMLYSVIGIAVIGATVAMVAGLKIKI